MTTTNNNPGLLCIAMDRRTGQVIEAISGGPQDVLAIIHLHPLLLHRLTELDSRGPRPHPEDPLGHAELKAVNLLLWQRGPDADESAFRELTVQTLDTFASRDAGPIPFCANCAALMHDTPNSAGRYTGFPPGPQNYLSQ